MLTSDRSDRLSPRQRTCLQWVAAGKTSWETGCILRIAERTVNFHLQNAYARLGVHTRAAAIATAMQSGVLGDVTVPPPPGP